MRKADPELHERRRRQIIDAARTRFIANGFHQTGVQDIATAAGISLGLLYRYFKNKDALILEVAHRDVDAIVDAVAAMPDAGVSPEFWGQHMRDFVLAVATDKNEMRLLNDIQSEAGRNPLLFAQMQTDDARISAAIEQKLIAQKVAGSLPPHIDTATVSLQLTVIFDGMLARIASSTAGDRKRLGQVLSAWVRALLDQGPVTAQPQPNPRELSHSEEA
jgi:AcrR family transcriptional regulator